MFDRMQTSWGSTTAAPVIIVLIGGNASNDDIRNNVQYFAKVVLSIVAFQLNFRKLCLDSIDLVT